MIYYALEVLLRARSSEKRISRDLINTVRSACFSLMIAKPQVLLVGQYSVGKTSFIRYLLGRDFPGQRIGPEPTTDRFTGEFILVRYC